MNEATSQGSGEMFDAIAGRYDLLNDLMSFGLWRLWRRKLVHALGLEPGARVLDVATGTADIALAIAAAHPEVSVVGLDPSTAMLAEGERKIDLARCGDRVRLVQGDAQHMPELPDAAFDAVCIAYGIRNVPDRGRALSEMARVTRPGGRVVVLELSEPRGWLAPAARLHVHGVVPRLGAWLSGAPEYAYLARSIAAFPEPATFAEMMQISGVAEVRIERMAFGAAHLYVGSRGDDRPLGQARAEQRRGEPSCVG